STVDRPRLLVCCLRELRVVATIRRHGLCLSSLTVACSARNIVSKTRNRRSNDFRNGHATQPQVLPRKLQCAVMYIMQLISTAGSVENLVNLIPSLTYSVPEEGSQ